MRKVVSIEDRIWIGLTPEKLSELMRSGKLCGADIQTREPEAKAFVYHVCLEHCAQKMCHQCEMKPYCEKPVFRGMSKEKG